MKRLIFPLFLLLIYSASSQDLSKFIYPDRFENSKTCLTKNNIATETVYNFNSLKKKSDSTVAMIITYDKEGNIINRQILNNNILSINETYVYNAERKIFQIIKESYSSKNYRVFEYEYDTLGNEIKEYIYNQDKTNLIVNAKVYNTKNQVSEYYTKKDKDSFRLEKTYSYNENNILTKIEVLNLKRKVISIYSYIVDTNNNYKVAYNQSNLNKNQKEEFIYNNLNNCIRVNGYAMQPKTYINDNSNNYTEVQIIPRTEEFEYNDNGTLSVMTEKVGKKIIKVSKHYYTTY